MTADAAVAGRSADELLRRVPLRPAEGWLTLLATAVMVVVFGGTLQAAGWTPDAERVGGFLPWAGLAGLAFGVGGAKLGWSRWRTHLLGALFAGIILPLVMGGIALGDDVGWGPRALAERLGAALEVMKVVWTDLVILDQPYTNEYAHYHLVFGALVWGAGMLAGYTVFGHHRPLDAVVVIGLAILANMALTQNDLWMLLIFFSAAALLLLIRTHVFEEEVTWTRRRIGDPAAVGQLYLRGGMAFVAVAVLGSVLLTATASSAPLQGVWSDLPRHLQSISELLRRIAPRDGNPRPLGIVGFGDNATTLGVWDPSNATAFRAQFDPTEERQFKWRAGTYSEYTRFGWRWGETRDVRSAARDPLLSGQADEPTIVGHRTINFRVVADAFRFPTIVGPNTVQSVDRPVVAKVIGNDGWFTTVEGTENNNTYSVGGLVPLFEDVPGGITEPRLRFAGTDYPPELLDLYTRLPENAFGPAASALLDDIRNAVDVPEYAEPDNVYDLARTMERYLQDEANFTYSDDVVDEMREQCEGVSTVECFAIIRAGYCEFYASTMTVLLREAGVPARLAYGFLPGERADDGLEVVQATGAHWWVEVYFPGIGWVEFDPTGGGVGEPQAIPTGSVGPPTARPSVVPRTAPPEFSEPPSQGPAGPLGGPGGGIGPFIAIAIILAIGIGALMLAAYRRTPNRPMHPDQAWGSVGRLAARIGLGPRPSQTVYEYAGALGEAVPAARVELTTIARAKVEVAYGRRDLGNDRLRNIAEAYHRLRFALLGVLARRLFRRRRP